MLRSLIIFSCVFLCASFVYANGGDMRVTNDGRFLALLSKAPYTPRQGVPTNMLISFLKLKQGEAHHEAVRESVLVRVRITKQGHTEEVARMEGSAEGGIYELSHTFENFGLHEIFVDLAYASNPDVWISFPDYLIDVQERAPDRLSVPWFLVVGIGIIAVGVGFLFGRRKA